MQRAINIHAFNVDFIRSHQPAKARNNLNVVAVKLILHNFTLALHNQINSAQQRLHGWPHGARSQSVHTQRDTFPRHAAHGFAKCFAGNGSGMNARATNARALLHYAHALSKFGRLHSGALTRWSAANHNQVIFIHICHKVERA